MAEEGQTRAVAKSLPKSQPSRVSVKPARLPPAESCFLSRTILSAAPGDSRRGARGPRTAGAGAGACGRVRSLSCPSVRSCQTTLPLPGGEQLSGGAGGAGLGAATLCLFCFQADFIQKLPSRWETSVPQFDLFKEYSVLMRFLNLKTLSTRFMN